MRSIQVLPESARSCMRSGILLFDLTRVVEELVFNSLDAGATKVIVAVGVGTSYIKVTDNGYGITRDGLVLLGERYATSKVEQLAGVNTVPKSFGFRGEALSSISDVSLLEVVTKAHGMPNGYRKVIKGCKCLYLGIDDDRQDVGTTVIVRDLFYNQPVKRRHLQSSPKKVLQSVKECILNIALVHLATCFKVVDIESGDELLSLHPSSSPLPILTSGFGVEVSHSLHKLDESDGNLKLSGYISGPCETFSVKAFQYFYINSRYISRGPIHKLLSQLAATHDSSDFLKADIKSQCGKRSRFQASPTYILNLTCPRVQYDLSFEPAKTCVEFKDWDPVFTFIKKAVSLFWSEDILISDRLPKKRCNQDSVLLSSPQFETPREEPKHMPLGGYICNRSETYDVQFKDYDYTTSDDTYSENKEQVDLLSDVKWRSNSLHIAKPASPVSFHIDDDLMKPFLRSCSSRIDMSHAVKKTKGDDKFKKWLYMDDDNSVSNAEDTNLVINGSSEPLRDDRVNVWSPPRITTSKRSFDTLLTGEDCLIEDNSIWTSPVASIKYSQSSHRSVEPLADVMSKRSFEQGGNDEFDLFARNSPPRIITSNGSFNTLLAGADCLTEDNSHWTSPVALYKSSQPSHRSTKDDWYAAGEKVHVEPLTDVVSKGHFEQGGNNEYDLFVSRSKGSFDTLLTAADCFTEDNSHWTSPVALYKYSQSSHRSTKDDLYAVGEKLHVEPLTDVVSKGHFEQGGNGKFDLFVSRSKGSFDTLLTGADCLTEDDSHWTSPIASVRYSQSSHRSSKGDWSAFDEKLHLEPLTDVLSKGHFEQRGNDDFDLFAQEEEEKGIFDFDCKKKVRSSHNDSIFRYESDWTKSPVAAPHHMPSLSYADKGRSKTGHSRIQDKKRRRSSSAPPFYREKKKIIALNSSMTDKAPTLQEASHLKHTDKSFANDLQSKARHDKKKLIDKAEISDHKGEVANCLDVVLNTNSDVTSKENQDALDFGVKWRNNCPLISSIQKPNDDANEEKILDISSGKLHLSGDSLLPKSTSKKCLQDCRVLYQVDKKFIPIVGGGILAIIDQHAADERIRLEDLREKVLCGETKTIAYLDAEQELVLPEIGYQLLNSYSEQIQKWGWICNFHAQSSVSFKKNLNFLNNQPSVATLIAVPCILGVNLTDIDLLEFLQQLADTDGSSVIPPGVLRILNSKACRGAIMFGDALLPSECSLIVEELKNTSMCFQCAHGRPTTAPLVNLVALHKQIDKLGNWSHHSSGPWHGLSRHRPSFERASERLSQC